MNRRALRESRNCLRHCSHRRPASLIAHQRYQLRRDFHKRFIHQSVWISELSILIPNFSINTRLRFPVLLCCVNYRQLLLYVNYDYYANNRFVFHCIWYSYVDSYCQRVKNFFLLFNIIWSLIISKYCIISVFPPLFSYLIFNLSYKHSCQTVRYGFKLWSMNITQI